MVYIGGSYSYGETIANKRGVVLSTDAGVSATDMTFDGTDEVHPNGIHPDKHDIVTHPNDPFKFFETGDGGVMRSSGGFVNRSSWCDNPNRGSSPRADLDAMPADALADPATAAGHQQGHGDAPVHEPLGQPAQHPASSRVVRRTTAPGRDAATRAVENTMIGDGGQSGFDVAIPDFRFHNYFDATTEVNFDGGEIENWIWIADPIFGHAGTQFYAPVISDPVVSKTMFAGTGRTAYRTKTAGLGTMTMEEAQQHCNSWTGDFAVVCGDWAELGAVRLTDAAWGDRAGPAVSAIERSKGDASTGWAATTTGRVFISRNINADPASAVTWTRLDDDAVTPNRFVSSIHVDPANPNRAWISYSGYNVNTPATPGHVFVVDVQPGDRDLDVDEHRHDWGDLPVNDLVRDDASGDLYASSDFGVMRREAGTTSWTSPRSGMPNVEVAGLTVVSGRRLFAATHGLSAWYLDLGHDDDDDDDDDDN